jgi:superfamily I DNA/RNA helicase
LVDALFPVSEAWAQPLRSAGYALEDPDFEAPDLLDKIRLEITQPELPTDVEYVRVMSLHKSKGLTADFVAIVGCVEGLIPFVKPKLTPAEQQRALQEQRRLFYVSLTRTGQALLLSSVAHINPDLAYRMGARIRANGSTIASRFLGELGPSVPRSMSGSALRNL